MMITGFTVIDKMTNRAPDLEKIALEERWASGLVHYEMSGFLIGQDGTLYLSDLYGNYRCCPYERFEIVCG